MTIAIVGVDARLTWPARTLSSGLLNGREIADSSSVVTAFASLVASLPCRLFCIDRVIIGRTPMRMIARISAAMSPSTIVKPASPARGPRSIRSMRLSVFARGRSRPDRCRDCSRREEQSSYRSPLDGGSGQ